METKQDLTPWEIVGLARHEERPRFSDYLNFIINDFVELHGDRCFGEDNSIIAGLGKIGREKFMIVGQEKGKDLDSRVKHNFGQAQPEGYRKAGLKMKLAEKYGIPVLTFIDTPGAYCGVGAEERGQAQAIAENMKLMSNLKVPIISVNIGEGGSGGALGIGIADRTYMLENSVYTVISPEGCAAILYKDSSKMIEAANALNPTAQKALELGVIEGIIPEPKGGAHLNHHETFLNVGDQILTAYEELRNIPIGELVEQRYEKLRNF